MSNPSITSSTQPLTVGELIAFLNQCDPNSEIAVREGGTTGAIVSVRQVGDQNELNLLFEDFPEVPERAVIVQAEF